MPQPTPLVRSPASDTDLAAELAGAATTVRLRGAGTKWGWAPEAEPGLVLSTAGLDRVVEHNAGDLTAVLEAGVPLERAQRAFREANQMLALDPPDPGGATVGGIVATADSGPLRTRYGGPRDLVLGMRVALADGTIAKSGSNVIKNVAGYDLGKLFTGSYGRLGAILAVSVRLHPLPADTATAVGHSAVPATIARAAAALAHARMEHLALDVRWEAGVGSILSRFGGTATDAQALAAQRTLRECGLEVEITHEDEPLWQAQRESQRSPSGLVARVSGVQTDLERLIGVAERHGALLVGRAALGLYWLRLDTGDQRGLADELGARYVTALLDRPADFEAEVRDRRDPGTSALMQRLKERFDADGRLV